MNRFWQALAVAGAVSSWSASALADGKVTLQELAQLLQQLGMILGIKELETLSIEIPGAEPVQLGTLADKR